MKTRKSKYPMPTLADTTAYDNVSENELVDMYNTMNAELFAQRKTLTPETASEWVGKLLPVICKLGEIRTGMPIKTRSYARAYENARHFTDVKTRRIAKYSKVLGAEFKKHGWNTSIVCSPTYDMPEIKDDVKITTLSAPATSAPIPAQETTPSDDNIDRDFWHDVGFTDKEIDDNKDMVTGWVKETTETSPVAPVADNNETTNYISCARASVSTSNDEEYYNESALFDVLGGYEVVDEQVADVAVENNNESSDNMPSASDNETSAWAPVTDDDMALAIESRLSACETIGNNMDTRLAKLRQHEENRLASESVWAKLRHFFFGFTDNEIAAMHAACA